jgi:16S rRNA (cytidine1402-2'-O)-methyltransferase
MISCHDYNEKLQVEKIARELTKGKSIALITDAGTPLISDPGYRLVYEIKQLGFNVIPVPGACAAITALSASGLPADKFIFEGFLSAKQQARIQHLEKLKTENRTIIFYESPHRILKMLDDMLLVFGEERYVVIARELTKQFETIYGAKLIDLISWIKDDPNQQKGEFVVLVKGDMAAKAKDLSDEDMRIINLLAAELPLKQASHLAAKITGKKKNTIYQLLLDKKS